MSISAKQTWRAAAWPTGVVNQCRIIGSLMVRDALKRYGHENLGFFWVIAEPLFFCTMIMLLWTFAHLSHGGDVEIAPFALTGYAFMTMWRHISGKCIGIINQNLNLRYHRQVKLIDAVIAMALLELIGCFSSFLIAYVPLRLFDLCPTMNDPLVLVTGYFFSAVFSLGFGLLLAGLSERSEVLHHLIPAIMYGSIPLTGIFVMQSWLPPNVSAILLWSPLVNGIEMFRGGLFPPSIDAMYNFPYLLATSLGTLIVGYAVFFGAQKRAEV